MGNNTQIKQLNRPSFDKPIYKCTFDANRADEDEQWRIPRLEELYEKLEIYGMYTVHMYDHKGCLDVLCWAHSGTYIQEQLIKRITSAWGEIDGGDSVHLHIVHADSVYHHGESVIGLEWDDDHPAIIYAEEMAVAYEVYNKEVDAFLAAESVADMGGSHGG